MIRISKEELLTYGFLILMSLMTSIFVNVILSTERFSYVYNVILLTSIYVFYTCLKVLTIKKEFLVEGKSEISKTQKVKGKSEN